jgi:uncharacterized cupin superfamily protein
MVFEETAPPGTETTYRLHHDSDEVAYVLSREITCKVDDVVTVGGPGVCAFMPRAVPHALNNTGTDAARVLFLYTPGGAGKFFEEREQFQRSRARRLTKRRRSACASGTVGKSSDRRRSGLIVEHRYLDRVALCLR